VLLNDLRAANKVNQKAGSKQENQKKSYLEKDIKMLENFQHRVIKAIKGYKSLDYLVR
jgi:hypothetical protein